MEKSLEIRDTRERAKADDDDGNRAFGDGGG